MVCKHPGDEVVYDVGQKDAVWRHDHSDYAVQWCRWCGAYRILMDYDLNKWTAWECPKPPRFKKKLPIADRILDFLSSRAIEFLVFLIGAALFSALAAGCLKFIVWCWR